MIQTITLTEEAKMKEAKTNFRELISGKLSNNKATSTNKDGSVTQYGVTNAELLYSNTQYIDAATKAALYQWFASRIINTEEQEDFATDFDEMGIPSQYFSNVDFGKFIRFFNTELLNDEYRYKELLRIERTQFDPMVANYLEEWSKDTHTGQNASTSLENDTPALINEQTVRTDNTSKVVEDNTMKQTAYNSKVSTDVQHDINETTSNTHSATTHSETEDKTVTASEDTLTYNNLTETDESKQASMAKNLPNSIMYNGATAGSLPSLDWSTGSGQNQAEADATRTTNGSTTNSHEHDNMVESDGTVASDDSGAKTGANRVHGDAAVKSGTDTVNNTGSTTENNTGTVTTATTKTSVSGRVSKEDEGSDSYENEHKEVHTGRTNILPQEAMPKAINYIKNSRAFDWLKGELDSCFLQIL